MSPPRLFLTRPEADSQRFADALQSAGGAFDAMIAPVLQIVPLGALPDLAGCRGLIFTSRHGVAAYRRNVQAVDLPAYTVGAATARAAREAGLQVQSADGDAARLVAWLSALKPPGPLLHIRGRHTRGEVAARLTEAGVPTQEAILYDQVQRPMDAAAQNWLAGHLPLVVPLFSPRSATLFASFRPQAPLLVAAMSASVAKRVDALHICAKRVAKTPDSPAMLQATRALLDDPRALEASGPAV